MDFLRADLGKEYKTNEVFPGFSELIGDSVRFVQVTYTFVTSEGIKTEIKLSQPDFNEDDYE